MQVLDDADVVLASATLAACAAGSGLQVGQIPMDVDLTPNATYRLRIAGTPFPAATFVTGEERVAGLEGVRVGATNGCSCKVRSAQRRTSTRYPC